ETGSPAGAGARPAPPRRGSHRRRCTSFRRDRGAGRSAGLSILPEVTVDFPGRDGRRVLLPLLALGLDEPAVDVLAQRIANDFVRFEAVQRLVQVAGQLVDPV